ncbi:MAG: hypothetical protein U1C74_17455 [Phenylobacterium sp.]|nr:hypothetical protein [Phenylobacterium sp.]
MLSELSELDLAAAKRLHGVLMVEDDVPKLTSLANGYKGLARCLRQTLALKAKLRREATQPVRPPSGLDSDRLARARRLDRLTEAVRAAAAEVGCEPAEQADIAEQFHAEAWDWIERPDFLVEDIDVQIDRAVRLMDLDDEDPDDGEEDAIIEGQSRPVPPPDPPPDRPPKPAEPYIPPWEKLRPGH